MHIDSIEQFLEHSKFTDNQKKQIGNLCVQITQMAEPTTITQLSGLFPVGFSPAPTLEGAWISFKKQHPIKTSFGLEHDTYEFLMIPPSTKRKIEKIFERPAPTKRIAQIRFINGDREDVEYISMNNSSLNENVGLIGFNISPTKTKWFNMNEIKSFTTDISNKPITGQGESE